MFWSRTSRGGVEVAFTDGRPDVHVLRPGLPAALAEVEAGCGVPFARTQQVHGARVHTVATTADPAVATPPEQDSVAGLPEADALVTTARGLGLMVRAADCVPVVLADPGAGVVGVAHAGRAGTALGVVTRTVETMVESGARPVEVTAWIGPHVCGACYEVPEEMRAEVADLVPQTWATTRAGTPALDLGAGARAQLEAAGVRDVVDVGGCTVEEARLPSHRRQGATAARLAGLVWIP